jgi:hypothetical protein
MKTAMTDLTKTALLEEPADVVSPPRHVMEYPISGALVDKALIFHEPADVFEMQMFERDLASPLLTDPVLVAQHDEDEGQLVSEASVHAAVSVWVVEAQVYVYVMSSEY